MPWQNNLVLAAMSVTGAPRGERPSRLARQRPAGGDIGGHVRDHHLHGLPIRDRPAERDPPAGVRGGFVQRPLGHADHAGRQRDPAVVEERHRHLEALANLTELPVPVEPQAVEGHCAVPGAGQPHRPLAGVDDQAARSGTRDEEGRQRVGGGPVVGCHGEDEVAGPVGECDQVLAPGGSPAVAVGHGTRVEVAAAATGGLGQRERTERASGGHVAHDLVLFRRAVRDEGSPEPVADVGEHAPAAGSHRSDLQVWLELRQWQPVTAVFAGYGGPENAEVCHARDERLRHPVGCLDLRSAGLELVQKEARPVLDRGNHARQHTNMPRI
jgi:hypothetical protein